MKLSNTDLDRYRVPLGKVLVTEGMAGAYKIPYKGRDLFCIVDDAIINKDINSKWEHVSISVSPGNRNPNWEEMCYVKDLFWGEDETVIQFHPKKSEYVNNHPHVLHLWKKVGEEFELPPKEFV